MSRGVSHYVDTGVAPPRYSYVDRYCNRLTAPNVSMTIAFLSHLNDTGMLPLNGICVKACQTYPSLVFEPENLHRRDHSTY